MKKIVALLIMVFAGCIAFNSAIAAQTTDQGSALGLKIAVVDLSKALNEVNEGKKAKANLEKEFKEKKNELDKIKGELESLRADLEKKAAVLSPEALQADQENFRGKFSEYQQKAQEYTQELARKEGEMTSQIIGKLRTVVEKIAQKDGYTFVLEKSQGGVVYGPANADITDDLIKQYNK